VWGQKGVYTFRIRGTLCHQIGSLLPVDNQPPKFAQIYIMDSDLTQQVQQRLQYGHGNIDDGILRDLILMMQHRNPYYRIYKIAKERISQNVNLCLSLTTADVKKRDPHRYNLPTASEVGVIIRENMTDVNTTRDLIVEYCSGKLKRVPELHSGYLPMRFPLLYPYGEQGWQPGIPLSQSPSQTQQGIYHSEDNHHGESENGHEHVQARGIYLICLHKSKFSITYLSFTTQQGRTQISQLQFYAYYLHTRDGIFSTIHLSGRLFQEWLVDAFAQIENNRLQFHRCSTQPFSPCGLAVDPLVANGSHRIRVM
jgi:hypothetical protein